MYLCRLQVTNRLLEKQPNHLTTQHTVKLIEQLNHMISDNKRYTTYVNIAYTEYTKLWHGTYIFISLLFDRSQCMDWSLKCLQLLADFHGKKIFI